MKTRFLASALLVVSVSGLTSQVSFAGDAAGSRRIASVARKAVALVQRIVGSSGAGGGGIGGGFPGGGAGGGFPGGGFPGGGAGGGFPGGGFPGGGMGSGGTSVGGIQFPWHHENDDLALPAFIQSSQHLGLAGNAALEAEAAFLSGNIQFAVFRFATACSRLSLGKLALTRANYAAIQPPVKNFGVFNPEVLASLNEMEQTRVMVGCP